MKTRNKLFRIRQDIDINATKRAVWDVLFDSDSFRYWGAAFMDGSYFLGEWVEGGTVRYLVDGENGKPNGMISRVEMFIPRKFACVRHIGIVSEGVDDFESEQAREWTPAEESFFVEEFSGVCCLNIEAEIPESRRQFFEEKWTVALQRIKETAEQ